MRIQTCPQCATEFATYQRKFCSKSCYTAWQKGKDFIGDVNRYRQGIPPVRYGISHPHYKPPFEFDCKTCGKPVVQRNYRRAEAKYCCRACHYQDNEGRSSANEKARKTKQYKDWRTAVFERDDYTCQGCGQRGVTLHADHIKPFAYYPELRFDIDNGRTLCVPCHKATDTYGAKAFRRLAVAQEA